MESQGLKLQWEKNGKMIPLSAFERFAKLESQIGGKYAAHTADEHEAYFAITEPIHQAIIHGAACPDANERLMKAESMLATF